MRSCFADCGIAADIVIAFSSCWPCSSSRLHLRCLDDVATVVKGGGGGMGSSGLNAEELSTLGDCRSTIIADARVIMVAPGASTVDDVTTAGVPTRTDESGCAFRKDWEDIALAALALATGIAVTALEHATGRVVASVPPLALVTKIAPATSVLATASALVSVTTKPEVTTDDIAAGCLCNRFPLRRPTAPLPLRSTLTGRERTMTCGGGGIG